MNEKHLISYGNKKLPHNKIPRFVTIESEFYEIKMDFHISFFSHTMLGITQDADTA